VVAFLIGPDSSRVTGQIIAVDGGHHLRAGPDFRPFDYSDDAPVACVLGGRDRRTLFIWVGPEFRREAVLWAPLGRIDAVQVEVAGAGRP
jgi:hypothetical protein